MKNSKIKNAGMTLTEVCLAMMVMVIFMSVFTLIAKYFQSYARKNLALDREKNSLIQNQQKILNVMDNWSEILSQPSYTKEDISQLKCSYPPNDGSTLWDLPGTQDIELPQSYKYCIIPTSLGESELLDLMSGKNDAKPGIYFLYAIPDRITSTSRPIRRMICRPITYC